MELDEKVDIKMMSDKKAESYIKRIALTRDSARIESLFKKILITGRRKLVDFFLRTISAEDLYDLRLNDLALEMMSKLEDHSDHTDNDDIVNDYPPYVIDVILDYISEDNKSIIFTTAIERNRLDIVKIFLEHNFIYSEEDIELAEELGFGRIISILERNFQSSAFPYVENQEDTFLFDTSSTDVPVPDPSGFEAFGFGPPDPLRFDNPEG